MPIKIVADENVDFRIIKKLREKNFEVLSIFESHSGITDNQVLEITRNSNAFLLTEDSDFGELVFSHKEKNVSVIFLRFVQTDVQKITDSLIHTLNQYGFTLANKFVVITPKKIRIRDI